MEAVPGIEFYVIGDFIFASIVLMSPARQCLKTAFRHALLSCLMLNKLSIHYTR